MAWMQVLTPPSTRPLLAPHVGADAVEVLRALEREGDVEPLLRHRPASARAAHALGLQLRRSGPRWREGERTASSDLKSNGVNQEGSARKRGGEAQGE